MEENIAKGVRSSFRSLFGQRDHSTQVTEGRIYISPIDTPDHTPAMYLANIYVPDNCSEGMVWRVEVPIEQAISRERTHFAAFRNLDIGPGKMVFRDPDSQSFAVHDSCTAKAVATSLRHHVADARMIC